MIPGLSLIKMKYRVQPAWFPDDQDTESNS